MVTEFGLYYDLHGELEAPTSSGPKDPHAKDRNNMQIDRDEPIV